MKRHLTYLFVRGHTAAQTTERMTSVADIPWIVLLIVLLSIGRSVAGTVAYNYDPLNRLTQVTYANGSTISYTYDAAGNRLTYSGISTNGGDTVSPSISILSPTNGATYATASSSVTLSGLASDNVGVSKVTWENDNAQIGLALGTTNWIIPSLPLHPGENYFYVTAYDAAGNSTGTILTVTLSSAVTNYAITLSASPNAGGTVSGSGTFASGSSKTVRATANSGYTFQNWVENGSVVSSTASYTFTVTGNRTLVANFTTPCTYSLSPTSTNIGFGSGSGSLSVAAGTECSWTVSSPVSWITITAGSSGSGNGTVRYSVAANTGRQRSTMIAVQGQTFVITQAGIGSGTPTGTYIGLFYEINEVRNESCGIFTLKVTSSGRFTGKLLLAGTSYSFRGELNANGEAVLTIARLGKSALTCSFVMDSGAGQITGLITDGNWSATVLGNRSPFNAQTNPASQSGKYTLVIPANDETAPQPSGNGFGTVTIDSAGAIRFSGVLSDGTKISQSAFLSADGQWPFYVSLYKGRGSLVSWITFAEETSRSLEGNLRWIKVGPMPKGNYRNGFTNQIAVVGSRYDPLLNQTWGLDFGNGTLLLENGNLIEPLLNNATLSANVLTASSGATHSLILKRTATTGLLKGSFIHPATGKKTPINGVILQKQNNARGFFLGPNESGAFSLDGN